MKINNELLLMYTLGRVSDPVVHDYITEQLEVDPEMAARLHWVSGADEEATGASRETREALEYFVSPRRLADVAEEAEAAGGPPLELAAVDSQSRPGPLDVTVKQVWGAAASGQTSLQRPENCLDLKRQIIDFRRPATDARCQHGVVLAKIYKSQASATCVGTVLIPITAVDGQFRGRASIHHVLAEHQLTAQARVEFWDQKETICNSCSMAELVAVVDRADLTTSCRDRIQALIAGKPHDR